MNRSVRAGRSRAAMIVMRTEDVKTNPSARFVTVMPRLLAAGAWMIVLSVLLAGAAAGTVVDDFQTAQGEISAPAPGPGSSSVNGAGIIGADRDLSIARLAGVDSVSAEAVGGELEMADGSGRASLEVVYDADSDPSVLDPVGLGGVDLTDGGTANAFRVVTTLVADAVDLTVTVYTDGTLVSTAARRITAAGTTIFPFGSFLATGTAGAADFANAGAIVVELTTAEVALALPTAESEPTQPVPLVAAPVIAVDLIDTIGPVVTAATKDALDVTGTSDVDPALPGQTLTYRIEVPNTGGPAAGVSFADVIDGNLTVVADSLTTRPFGVDDLYQAVGNVDLIVDAAAGLLANDRDADDGATPQALTVTAFDATSVGGGSVAVAADGSFVYISAGGFGGADAFAYTVTDNEGQTDTGTVTVIVADTVWFVDNTVAPGGSGTFVDPFHALASAEAASAAGHTIRVRRGDGTDTNHDVGINLKPGQKLIGAGVALVISGVEIEPADAMGAPTISHTGHVVDLADDVEVRGLVINANAATAEHGIRGSGVSGQIAVSDVVIGGNGNHGGILLGMSPAADVSLTNVDVVAGDEPALQVADVQSVALAGSCDFSSAGTVMDIATTTLTGTVQTLVGAQARFATLAAASSFAVTTSTTLTNPSGIGLRVLSSPNVNLGFGTTSITDNNIGGGNTATAIDLATGNAGATIGFASLAVVADGGTGLRTGMGTVDVAAATSTVAATGGPAIDANGTTLTANAASGWTFASLSSTNSVGRGLRLSSTTGNVTVSGSTLLTGATGRAVDLSSAGATTFTGQLVAASTGAEGFFATGSGPVTVANNTSMVSATGASAISMTSTNIGAAGMAFASVMASTTGALPGAVFNNVDAGAFVAQATTIAGTGAGQHGIHITGSAAGFTWNGTTAVDDTGGDGIRLEGANGAVVFNSVAIDDTTGNGVTVSGNVATVDINGGTIGETAGSATTTAGNAVDVAGGTANVTVVAAIRNTAARSVVVTGRTAGTVEISGAINDTGTGIHVANNSGGISRFSNASKVVNTGVNQAVTLASNAGHAIEFTGGGLDLDTNGAAGFVATGGGTLQVAGAGNTVDAVSGIGVDINGVTLATAGGGPPAERGVVFQRVAASGGVHGIRLVNAGAGGFAVTGTGVNHSGGVVSTTTDDGVRLTNTDQVLLGDMRIATSGDDGLEASSLDDLTLDSVTIDGTATHGLRGTLVRNLIVRNNSEILNAGNANNEHAMLLTNLLGTCLFEDTLLDDFEEDGVQLSNFGSNTLDMLTVRRTTIANNDAPNGENGMRVQSFDTATINLTVEDSTFQEHIGDGLFTAAGQCSSVTAPCPVSTASSIGLTVRRTLFDGQTTGVAVGERAVRRGVRIGAINDGSMTFDISDNRPVAQGGGGGGFFDQLGAAITIKNDSNGLLRGVVDGNWIDGEMAVASDIGSGISLIADGASGPVAVTGSTQVRISNNEIRNMDQFGMDISAEDGSVRLDLELADNNVTTPAAAFFAGIRLLAQTGGSICLNASSLAGDGAGRNMVFGNDGGFPGAAGGLDLSESGAGVFELQGFAGGAAATFIDTHNFDLVGGSPAVAFGTFGTPAAACNTPP